MPGPELGLTQQEEQSIVNYLMYMSEKGLPFTHNILRAFVIAIVKENGRPSLLYLQREPSDEWCQNFWKKTTSELGNA